ncbi:glycosyltransferase family 87 protein [Ralstonia holmesii]|uniref:glycosyltransferase family 87 protein n=1 Tax=Ralstonia TaxID=48736 RepID=UPI001F432562|nr:glycosyltransferase family 87 protein [Ralstonia pickettii]
MQNTTIPSPGWDLAVFWSAANLAITHGATAAYDWGLLRAAEAAILPPDIFGPFSYPPTFLLLIYPIGMLSFGAATVVFSGCGIALYLGMLNKTLRSAPDALRLPWLIPAVAFPGVWVTLVTGQNSLFTAAVAGAALVLLRRSPVAAGACIAMLCIKPQLGILFPLYLLCERQWRALASAAFFSMLTLVVSWLAFGTATFVAAARSMAMFRHAIVENGGVILYGAPTVFGTLRSAGYSTTVSYAAHAGVAMLVIAVCVWLWRSTCRFELRAASLPVATLMVQPYLIYYDLAWLALPMAWLVVDFVRHSSNRFENAVLLAAWLVPAQGLFAVLSHRTGQWAPIVLVALLAIIVRRARAPQRVIAPHESFDAATPPVAAIGAHASNPAQGTTA